MHLKSQNGYRFCLIFGNRYLIKFQVGLLKLVLVFTVLFSYLELKGQTCSNFYLRNQKDQQDSKPPKKFVTDLTNGLLEEKWLDHPKFKHPRYYPYEAAIRQLKEGDSVKFGESTFVLGKFLGKGNATYVFQLKDQPEKAIRIPLLEEIDLIRVMGDDISMIIRPESWVAVSRYFVQRFVETAPNKKGLVKIYEVGREYSYLIVEFVPGTETGQNFLDHLNYAWGKKFGKSLYNVYDDDALLDFDQIRRVMKSGFLTEVQKTKLQGLFEIEHANNERRSYVGILGTRQYLWDTVENHWRLVDTE